MFKTASDLLSLIGGNSARSLYVFNLDGLDILRQLRFEEFIYRNASPISRNSSFFLVNGSHIDRSVVFGLSGKPVDFIKDFKFCRDSGVKLIRRFTGGGTVLIDENTVTSSFIGTHSFAPSLMANQICKWTFDNVYRTCNMFKSNFELVEGDFVVRIPSASDLECPISSSSNIYDSSVSSESIGHTGTLPNDVHVYFKVGGNAQALSKHSFVHHTCFLWSLSPLIDRLLLTPMRMPKYRNSRDHGLFLRSVSQCLNDTCATKTHFSHNLRESIQLNVENTFSFTYRPCGRMDEFTLDDRFVDSCIDSLKKPNTDQLPFEL